MDAVTKITVAPPAAVVVNSKEIVLDLSNPTKVIFIVTANGEIGTRMLHDSVLSLTKGLVYKIPITNPGLSTKNNFGIKLELGVSDNLRILNVDNGIATIECIVHGYVITDQLLLGSLF